MKNPLHKDINDVLNFDALAEAERTTGQSYKTCRVTEALGFASHIQHGREKEAVLKFTKDTHFSMTVPEYLAVAESLGFQQVFHRRFTAEHCGSEQTAQEFILFDPKRGILLHFDTYSLVSEAVNGGNYYFNWRQDSDLVGYLPFSGGHAKDSNDRWVKIGSFDCREGLRHYITMLDDNGEWITPWIERPWIWLLTWADTKGQYDHNAINAERIAALPKDVQSAISPTPTANGGVK